MFEQTPESSPSIDYDVERETKDIVDSVERINLKLTGIIRKMDTLLEMRRSAWTQRKVLERNFLLSAESRRQRLDQISRIMKPQGEVSECGQKCSIQPREVETADSLRPAVRFMERSYATFSSAEGSFDDCRLCTLNPVNPEDTSPETLDSFPVDSFFVNQPFGTPNSVAEITSNPPLGSDFGFSKSPAVLIDAASVRKDRDMSNAELCQRLIADLDEVHKRSVPVAGPGIIDPGFFWSDMLDRVKQAVAAQDGETPADSMRRSSVSRIDDLKANAKDSGLNFSLFSV